MKSRAVTMGKIADILEQRGQTDEALRIRREEEERGITAIPGRRRRASRSANGRADTGRND